MPLPPGVSARDFQTVLRQFESVVGKEWVFSSDEDVELYRDSYSPFWHEPEDPVPSAAVSPDSVEQVQQIVRGFRCGPSPPARTWRTAVRRRGSPAPWCSI